MDIIRESKKQFINSPSNEKRLQQIWVSLLDQNVFEDHQFSSGNEEECAFSMLLKVISFRYKKFLERLKSLENIKNAQEIEIKNLTLACTEKSEENKCLKMRECHSCQSYQEQLELEQNKLSQLEKQMKKCAFVLNTSIEREDVVLEKVRGFLSQSLMEKNETNNDAGTSDNSTVKSGELSGSDIIVPDTPEKADHSPICTQADSDDIRYIPETALFNFDEMGTSIKPAQSKFSPIPVRHRKNCASPKDISMNDSMFYSPPLFVRNGATKQTDQQYDDDDDFQNPSSCKKTINSSPTKKMKQTRLFSPTTSKPIPRRSDDCMNAGPISPPVPCSSEMKKRKRVKGPEDWTCTKCYRLFKEANIDTKKMKVSRNFCPEHRNRYSYYLGTPPGFLNPKIVGSPRKGRMSTSSSSKTTPP